MNEYDWCQLHFDGTESSQDSKDKYSAKKNPTTVAKRMKKMRKKYNKDKRSTTTAHPKTGFEFATPMTATQEEEQESEEEEEDDDIKTSIKNESTNNDVSIASDSDEFETINKSSNKRKPKTKKLKKLQSTTRQDDEEPRKKKRKIRRHRSQTTTDASPPPNIDPPCVTSIPPNEEPTTQPIISTISTNISGNVSGVVKQEPPTIEHQIETSKQVINELVFQDRTQLQNPQLSTLINLMTGISKQQAMQNQIFQNQQKLQRQQQKVRRQDEIKQTMKQESIKQESLTPALYNVGLVTDYGNSKRDAIVLDSSSDDEMPVGNVVSILASDENQAVVPVSMAQATVSLLVISPLSGDVAPLFAPTLPILESGYVNPLFSLCVVFLLFLALLAFLAFLAFLILFAFLVFSAFFNYCMFDNMFCLALKNKVQWLTLVNKNLNLSMSIHFCHSLSFCTILFFLAFLAFLAFFLFLLFLAFLAFCVLFSIFEILTKLYLY